MVSGGGGGGGGGVESRYNISLSGGASIYCPRGYVCNHCHLYG